MDNEIINLSGLNKEQKDIIFNQLLVEKVQENNYKLQELAMYAKLSIENINNDLNKHNERFEIVENNLKRNIEKEVFFANLDKHVNQRGLGELNPYGVKIGSEHVGILLKVVGICLSTSSRTIPHSENTQGKTPLCVLKNVNGNPAYYYHSGKTWKKIKNELEKIGAWIDFGLCKNTNEVHVFIKKLAYDADIYLKEYKNL